VISLRRRVFLFGYYGFGNLGDELLLEYYRQLLAEALPCWDRWVLTAAPQQLTPLMGEHIHSRWDLLKLLSSTCPGDIWLAGGGTLIQNATSNRSLSFYLGLIQAAQLRRAKTVLLGQGYGPVKGEIARLAVQKTLSRCTWIQTRDERAFNTLGSLRLSPTLYTPGVDPLWELKIDRVEATGQGILWIPKYSDLEFVPELSKALREKARDIRMLTFQSGEERLANLAPGVRYLGVCKDKEDFSRAVEGVGVVISSRLHGLILPSLAGLPVIGLGKDPKLQACCQLIGQPCLGLEYRSYLRQIEEAFASVIKGKELNDQVSLLQKRSRSIRTFVIEGLQRLGDK
jgi:polysaccharide pyruvyl transferase CsaB